MRPTAGLVSRSGVFAGWPSINGSLGPMARTVTDLAKLLDVMAGYDPDDPVTAHGVGRIRQSFTAFLDKQGLHGARFGILRESMGYDAEPASEDFNKISRSFRQGSGRPEGRRRGNCRPGRRFRILKRCLAKRAGSFTDEEESFKTYMSRSKQAPYKSRAEAMNAPVFEKVVKRARERWMRRASEEAHYEYLKAREQLMSSLLKVMADHRLDAIVHKAVEHQPTLIKDGVNPPYVDQKGAPHINTFLVYVPSIVVPAGFTRDQLPAGITFLGRPYDDGKMIQYAYGYEQATRHRKPPASVTPL